MDQDIEKIDLELTRKIYELETIQQISLELNASHDFETIIRIILQSVMGLLGATSGAIFTLNKSSETMYIQNYRGEQYEDSSIRLSPETISRVIADNNPIFIEGLKSSHKDLFENNLETIHKTKPAIWLPLVAKHKLLGIISLGKQLAEKEYTPETISFLRAIAGTVAQSLDNVQLYHSLQTASEGIIHAMASAIETRDPYTAGHQLRVSNLAAAIAEGLNILDNQVECIRLAGMIHDLGKISVPAEILSKPGRINDVEYNLIKLHPKVGFNILKDIELPWPIATIILQHHERIDGTGYPDGMNGEAMLIESRIIAVADVVEAMASHRPYRPALGIKRALDTISEGRGGFYDPDVVDVCLSLFHKGDFEF